MFAARSMTLSLFLTFKLETGKIVNFQSTKIKQFSLAHVRVENQQQDCLHTDKAGYNEAVLCGDGKGCAVQKQSFANFCYLDEPGTCGKHGSTIHLWYIWIHQVSAKHCGKHQLVKHFGKHQPVKYCGKYQPSIGTNVEQIACKIK